MTSCATNTSGTVNEHGAQNHVFLKSQKQPIMNLYVINEILADYTSGMCVIAAESKEHCRELFIKEFPLYGEDFDSEHTKFTIIEGVNHPAGIVDYVYGGG